jgi:hypothetical protein
MKGMSMKKKIKVETKVSMSEIVAKEDANESMPISYEDLVDVFNKVESPIITRFSLLKHTFPIRMAKKRNVSPTFELFIIRCITRLKKNPPFSVFTLDPELRDFIIERTRKITAEELNIISMPKKVWERVSA